MAGQITSIEIQKRNAERASIFIDGEFAFGLPLIAAVKLSKGQYLSDRDIAALGEIDEQERAYEYALGFLSYRPRSIAEVTRRLQKHEYGESVIEAAVERLCRAGLLDDRAFAQYWIRNREQFKPRGPHALRYELRQKGVDSDIVEPLLQELDETASAYRLALERVERWERSKSAAQMDVAALRKKLGSYLSRRGFGYSVIQQVWARIQAEQLADRPESEREEETVWDQEP